MTVHNKSLSRLELEALAVALANNSDPSVRDLFYLIPLLRAEEREHTGVGFVTKFARNAELTRHGLNEDFLAKFPPEAIGFHPNMEGCANFLVWVKSGQIDCLEAVSTSNW